MYQDDDTKSSTTSKVKIELPLLEKLAKMKPLLVLTLSVLTIIRLSSAIDLRIPNVVKDIFDPPSRVPQFLLDTRHPWIDENRQWLERLDDPVQSLCSLESPFRQENVQSGSGINTIPEDLFMVLTLRNNRGSRRPIHASMIIREIANCPAALLEVLSLTVDFQWGTDPSLKERELPELIVKTISSMPHLVRLDWARSKVGDRRYCNAFAESGLMLPPSVNELLLAQHVNCLARFGPSVEILELNAGLLMSRLYDTKKFSDLEFAYLLGDKSDLTHFSMHALWRVGYLKELAKAAPNLTSLNIDGKIRGTRYQRSPYRFDQWEMEDDDDIDDDLYELYEDYHSRSGNETIEEYATTLVLFPNLEHLRLPPAHRLNLGYGAGPGCGNVYFGRSGREYGRSRARLYAQTIETATEIILSKLPNLKTLDFGGEKMCQTEDREGKYSITWPWTGRLEDWLYEQYPLEERWPGEDAQNPPQIEI